MIEVKITGSNEAEIRSQIVDLANLFGAGGDAPAASGGRRGRKATATDAPAENAPAATTPPAADATADVTRAVAGVATVVEPDPDLDDGLGDDTPAVTRDGVKTLLVEIKKKFPAVPSVVADLIKSVAGVTKFADVKDEHLAAVHAAASKKLA
ncbi:hypothetical protein [Methylocystis hirsuta]|nr:hypothetical protein [Methylocystis hirsuta]